MDERTAKVLKILVIVLIALTFIGGLFAVLAGASSGEEIIILPGENYFYEEPELFEQL